MLSFAFKCSCLATTAIKKKKRPALEHQVGISTKGNRTKKQQLSMVSCGSTEVVRGWEG